MRTSRSRNLYESQLRHAPASISRFPAREMTTRSVVSGCVIYGVLHKRNSPGCGASLAQADLAPHRCASDRSSIHRCARCTLSRSSVVISAWRCGALIQRNSGDNHPLRGLVHLEGPQGTWGPPGSLRDPGPGPRAEPGGGQKLSPPGDGRHLTDFVAN